MQSYDVYIKRSLIEPFCYVEFSPFGEESGLSINRSLSSAFASAKRIVKYREFGSLVVLNAKPYQEVVDVNDDMEIMQAILAYS
jgi:hypothetical protein